MNALHQQSRLRLAMPLVIALFVPLHAAASPNHLRAMTEADLERVSAQGLTDGAVRQADHAKNASRPDSRQTLDKVTSSLNKQLEFLDAETTMKDVVYEPAHAQAVVNPDGSISTSMPRSIGELNFEHIRVKGNSSGPSFGNISIKGIELTGTTLTLLPRH